MNAATGRCPKCAGEMVQGFIVDWAQGGARRVLNWVEGAPAKSFWHGTRAPAEKSMAVGTFRCSQCGFLESFARPEFAAG
jgi:hypothetical protein